MMYVAFMLTTWLFAGASASCEYVSKVDGASGLLQCACVKADDACIISQDCTAASFCQNNAGRQECVDDDTTTKLVRDGCAILNDKKCAKKTLKLNNTKYTCEWDALYYDVCNDKLEARCVYNPAGEACLSKEVCDGSDTNAGQTKYVCVGDQCGADLATSAPTLATPEPTPAPTSAPTVPVTPQPTPDPTTAVVTDSPTVSAVATESPTVATVATESPTVATVSTESPTVATVNPNPQPTPAPTEAPTHQPTPTPSAAVDPTSSPTFGIQVTSKPTSEDDPNKKEISSAPLMTPSFLAIVLGFIAIFA